jgi:hypothetical protein
MGIALTISQGEILIAIADGAFFKIHYLNDDGP